MSDPNQRPIDSELIQRLESLAGLRLSPLERDALTGQLDRIVAFVAQLNQLKHLNQLDGNQGKSEAPPETPDRDPDSPLRRADEPRLSLPRREALDQAPQTDGSFFVVPPVFLPNPDSWPDRESGADLE